MELNPTVFLIDDDADDQEIFSIAINNTNKPAKCVFADDGIRALEKLNGDKNFIPDFIFIDMNMPRMNGKQCLEEIKKIDRLKHIPVYIYSTTVDPGIVEENIRLGATDFIVKPPDIHTLTNILSNILQKKLFGVMLCLFWFLALPSRCLSQSDTLPPVKELKKLSVEELMNIVVTSVSKSPQRLSEVASAIQVITANDIERSAATRLPEVLRLAANMQVAQSGSHDWGITSRGFNGLPVTSSSLADKLLVMIDGRTVYTPLFGGVFWDVQNVLLHDIDRVEVISGPGGTLWGANAVNGIVNIISKDAKETQGVYATAGSGTLQKDYEAIRFGSHIDTTLYFRVYGQHLNYRNTTLPGDIDAMDSWYSSQGGFRMDYSKSRKNAYTFQGDFYSGNDDDTGSTHVNGQNFIAHWTHNFSQKSVLVVQSYFDRTYRNITRQGFIDKLTTYDLDIQHSFSTSTSNKLIYGVGYRFVTDDIHSIQNDFIPAKRDLPLYNGFVQDQFAIIPHTLELTLGTKILHNAYSHFEFHPTVRLAFTPDSTNTIWAAVSRAVRTPTRYDADLTAPVLGSYGDFKSEKVNAYEIGYRTEFSERISFSLSGYFNQYFDLRSIDTNKSATPSPLFYFGNNMKAKTYGAELSFNFIAADWWRLRGGYTYLYEKFELGQTTYPKSNLFEALDPQNQFLIQSIMDLPCHFQLDGIFRYIDALPQSIDGSKVPSYSAVDLRVAWQYKWVTLSMMGKNLIENKHVEFGQREIPRRIIGKVAVVF